MWCLHTFLTSVSIRSGGVIPVPGLSSALCHFLTPWRTLLETLKLVEATDWVTCFIFINRQEVCPSVVTASSWNLTGQLFHSPHRHASYLRDLSFTELPGTGNWLWREHNGCRPTDVSETIAGSDFSMLSPLKRFWRANENGTNRQCKSF